MDACSNRPAPAPRSFGVAALRGRSSMPALGLRASLTLQAALLTLAANDGLALLPPMGWRTWNAFHNSISSSIIEKQADGLADTSRLVDGVPTSLRSLGYTDLGIDVRFHHQAQPALRIDLNRPYLLTVFPTAFAGRLGGLRRRLQPHAAHRVRLARRRYDQVSRLKCYSCLRSSSRPQGRILLQWMCVW